MAGTGTVPRGNIAMSALLKEIGGYVLLILAIFMAPLLAAVLG